MSQKTGSKMKRGSHILYQTISSRSITQIVCFAVVASIAVFGFVQARRAVYQLGESYSSIVADKKYAHGGSQTGSSVTPDNMSGYNGRSAFVIPSSTTALKQSTTAATTQKTKTTTTTTKLTSTTKKTTSAQKTTATTTTAAASRTTTSRTTTTKRTTSKTTTVQKTQATKTTAYSGSDTVRISVSPVNIRAGAGTEYKVIARTSRGKVYKLLGKGKDSDGKEWCKIALDGDITGWIMQSCCRIDDHSPDATTTSSTAAKTTTKTTAKTTAKTTTKTTTKTTVKTAKEGVTVEITVSPVNIRSGAGTGYNVIARTSRGKVYKLLGTGTDSTGREWCKIALDGDDTGWIMKSCCRLSDEPSSSTTASQKTTTAKSTTKATTAADSLLMSLQPEDHSAKYFIVVYKGSQSVVVYGKDSDRNYTVSKKIFTCSTGKSSSPTRTGAYHIRAKYRWRSLVGNVYGQFSSSISSSYLFHSVPYLRQDPSTLENEEYDKLGTPASKGCIRMCVRDCKWIYDQCEIGTQVRIVDDKGPAGPGVPRRRSGSEYDGWDPSDRWASANPYFN